MTEVIYENCCENRDIQMDLYPTPCRNPVMWGTVYDECKQPLSGGLVELFQCTNESWACCRLIGKAYSDCEGHYEIPLPDPCLYQERLRIKVSRPCTCKRKNNICYY